MSLVSKLASIKKANNLFRLIMKSDPKVRFALNKSFLHQNMDGVEKFQLGNIYKSLGKPDVDNVPVSVWLEKAKAQQIGRQLKPLLSTPDRLTTQMIPKSRLGNLDVVGQGDGSYFISPWASKEQRLLKETKHVGPKPTDADLNPAPSIEVYRQRLSAALANRKNMLADVSNRSDAGLSQGWYDKATRDMLALDNEGFLKSYHRRFQPIHSNNLSDAKDMRMWWERI